MGTTISVGARMIFFILHLSGKK